MPDHLQTGFVGGLARWDWVGLIALGVAVVVACAVATGRAYRCVRSRPDRPASEEKTELLSMTSMM